jgi:hypothetical protein
LSAAAVLDASSSSSHAILDKLEASLAGTIRSIEISDQMLHELFPTNKDKQHDRTPSGVSVASSSSSASASASLPFRATTPNMQVQQEPMPLQSQLQQQEPSLLLSRRDELASQQRRRRSPRSSGNSGRSGSDELDDEQPRRAAEDGAASPPAGPSPPSRRAFSRQVRIESIRSAVGHAPPPLMLPPIAPSRLHLLSLHRPQVQCVSTATSRCFCRSRQSATFLVALQHPKAEFKQLIASTAARPIFCKLVPQLQLKRVSLHGHSSPPLLVTSLRPAKPAFKSTLRWLDVVDTDFCTP